MSAHAKICGLTTPDSLDAALDGGAAFVGAVVFPQSPRHIEPPHAAALFGRARGTPEVVAVVVDAELVRRLVSAWPDLRDAPLERIGAGWDNTAWRVGPAGDGATWVVRFPHKAAAVHFMDTEIAHAGRIAAALPAPPGGWRSGGGGKLRAFWGYYADWVGCLGGPGAQVVDFSPLQDEVLP